MTSMKLSHTVTHTSRFTQRPYAGIQNSIIVLTITFNQQLGLVFDAICSSDLRKDPKTIPPFSEINLQQVCWLQVMRPAESRSVSVSHCGFSHGQPRSPGIEFYPSSSLRNTHLHTPFSFHLSPTLHVNSLVCSSTYRDFYIP